jgi:hypothetical protein
MERVGGLIRRVIHLRKQPRSRPRPRPFPGPRPLPRREEEEEEMRMRMKTMTNDETRNKTHNGLQTKRWIMPNDESCNHVRSWRSGQQSNVFW